MAEDNSAKMGLIAAVIGAVGAIVAAIIPIYLSHSSADPPAAPSKPDSVKKSRPTGDGSKPKGSTPASPKPEHKVPADLARLKGQWSVAQQTSNTKVFSKDDLNRQKVVYDFDGDRLTIVNHGDQRGLVYWRGTIRLHPDLSPKTFDVKAKNRLDEDGEILGVYAFEGQELVLRYRAHTIGKSAKPARPNSFQIERAADAGSLVRLRRAKG